MPFHLCGNHPIHLEMQAQDALGFRCQRTQAPSSLDCLINKAKAPMSTLGGSVWRYQKSKRNRIWNFFRYWIQYFFQYQIFSDTESDTYFETKFFQYQIRHHLKNWNCLETDTNADTKFYKTMFKTDKSKILLIIFFYTESETLFLIPNISNTEPNTFLGTKFFPIPNPIFFSIPIFFDTESDFNQKIGKVLKPRSFETEMSHSAGRWHTSKVLFFLSSGYLFSHLNWQTFVHFIWF